MSDVVIRAEGLGKRYLIGHQAAGAERYTSLRDVLGSRFGSIVRSARDMLQGRQIVIGDEIEEFWALKDVSFEIKRGEVVGIIGRNGAGKSTLLKILSRITEPTTGRVEIKGRVASLLEVGTGFHPELTGRENIFLNGAILGMSRAEIRSKFDEIVAFAEVEKFLDTPVKRYSSGMYVRLAFAVAAHLEPEILVVDEVLAVGDVEFQKKCLGKMQDVAGHGRTVLFVSHNMAAVRRLCDVGILLRSGQVGANSSIQHVLAAYGRNVDQSSAIDLNSRNDRRGTGWARLTSVGVAHGSNAIAIGEKVQLVFHGQAEFADQVRCWCLFRTTQGDDLLMVMPPDEPLMLRSGEFLATCSFINPLLPGKYTASCGILRKEEIVDWVDDTFFINVEAMFETGQPYDGRLGTITIFGDWRLRDTSAIDRDGAPSGTEAQ